MEQREAARPSEAPGQSSDGGNIPKPIKRVDIDDPRRGIETKIVVYDMAPDSNVVVDFVAQVYRRRDVAGNWNVVHTTRNCVNEFEPLQLARTWHRANPTVMELRG